jgi:P-type Cu+ transporter
MKHATHEHAHHEHAHRGHAHDVATVPAGATVWTCPMHPEIRRDAPGACPICGMALGA